MTDSVRMHPAAEAKPPGGDLALQIGYDMRFDIAGPLPTAMIFMLHVHPEVQGQLERAEQFSVEPSGVPTELFVDPFGNRCARAIAPAGQLRVTYDNVFHTTGPRTAAQCSDAAGRGRRTSKGRAAVSAEQPLLRGGSASAIAWDQFGKLPPGGSRVLAINRWVFEHVRFGYRFTRPNKSALDTYTEGTGVCRDMTHLAITFCRSMNIPARYATGYLADIDADPDPTPMDFSAFYEVYLDGRWWPMDARHGRPRIGRVLIARGRDATDVALLTSFGRHKLTQFTVVTAPADTVPMQMPAPTLPLAHSA